MNVDVLLSNLPAFADGLWLTVKLTVISLVLGFVFSIPVAFARLSSNPLIGGAAFGFTFFFRGTPLIVQLFLVYYGAGQFRAELESIGLWRGLFREAWFCGLFTLTANTVAYTAEIIRGGIKAVPHGMIEAARAYGMSGLLLYRRIVIPNALRIALPAYGNEAIFLMQATSLVSLITLLDLTGVARKLNAKTFAYYETFLFIGLIYLLLTYSIVYLFRFFEKKLNPQRQASADVGLIDQR